ncbi:MAG: HAD family hydrolase [Epulopiscium sp. Nuni2H_MBin003]|nr:MAG: HAD family hydrolase [Epulopiscium sp. Nuni2H_MBin003]
MKFEAVIFDLDGTLVDSMWVWATLDDEFLEKFGYVMPKELGPLLEGLGFTETAQMFKDYFNLPLSIEEIKKIWNEMAAKMYAMRVDLKVGVVEFLEYLQRNKIEMGIATSNSIELTQLVLEKHNIAHFFKSIVTSCDVEQGKPHPFVYIEVAKRLGVEPEKCLVFEDIPNGIIGAKSANMTVWGIEDMQPDEVKIKAKKLADRWVQNYHEVIESL